MKEKRLFPVFRLNTAYWLARRAVRRRRVDPENQRSFQHTVLVILPLVPAEVDAAWPLLERIRQDVVTLHLVGLSLGSGDIPRRFMQQVRLLKASEFNWLGLPRRELIRELWSSNPNIALDLNPRFTLPSAYLTGASPATFRVGFYHPRAEPFFDFMVESPRSARGAIGSMLKYLRQVEPTLFV